MPYISSYIDNFEPTELVGWIFFFTLESSWHDTVPPKIGFERHLSCLCYSMLVSYAGIIQAAYFQIVHFDGTASGTAILSVKL